RTGARICETPVPVSRAISYHEARKFNVTARACVRETIVLIICTRSEHEMRKFNVTDIACIEEALVGCRTSRPVINHQASEFDMASRTRSIETLVPVSRPTRNHEACEIDVTTSACIREA